MTRDRLVLTGGSVFDGSGAAPARADIALEGSRIIDVGTGLDGDREIALDGRLVLPGMFDCHIHAMLGHIDMWRLVQTPFSLQFYEAARNLRATLEAGITSARDAGGADLGVKTALEQSLIEGPRLQISLSMISQTGGHGDDWYPSGARVPLLVPHPGVPDTLVDGPDEMRRAVRRARGRGCRCDQGRDVRWSAVAPR